eukprot:gene24300-31613_t
MARYKVAFGLLFFIVYMFPSLFGERIKYADLIANLQCHNHSVRYLYAPSNEEEALEIIRSVRGLNVSVSVRGGGHSYTCQSVQNNSAIIDTSRLNHIEIHDSDGILAFPYMVVGAGNTWHRVLKAVRERNLVTIHGQCRAVGVAGFLLHGGVHFGGLSHLFGMGSDQILGLTMLTSNGSLVRILSSDLTGARLTCFRDSSPMTDGQCEDIWFAMRGAGSSFGLVTSLTVRLYERPLIRSAITMLSVDLTHAAEVLLQYFSLFPTDISMTVYGLDASFKAFFFVLKYMREKWRIMDTASLLVAGRRKRAMIHFVVEATWTTNQDTVGQHDPVLKFLRELHKNKTIGERLCHNANVCSSDGSSSSSGNSNGSYSNHCILRDWAIVGTNNGMKGNIKSQNEMWSVYDYTLVWGKKHAYAAASITNRRDSSSVNRFLSENASLWMERSTWESCSAWVDDTQRAIDDARIPRCMYEGSGSDASNVSKRVSYHYPNVPNLVTDDWAGQYYGDHYARLQEVKRVWDPIDMFHHSQSVSPPGPVPPTTDVSYLHQLTPSSQELGLLFLFFFCGL